MSAFAYSDFPYGPREAKHLRKAVHHMTGRGGHRHGGGHGQSRPAFGPGPWGPDFIFGGPFGPGGGRGPFGRGGRGRRARRGDVRMAALILLAEEPRNGYQLMQELEQRSDGVWRPSPGSVYPALQQLEDEGLIRSTEADGRKLFEITDAGRAAVAERPEGEPAPWEQVSQGFPDDARELGGLMRDLAMAFAQVVRAGTDAQRAEAKKVLTDARRALYRILAEDDDDSDPSAA